MTEYFDGLRVEKEKNTAVPTDETRDELSHTPGPWRVMQGTSPRDRYVEAEDGTICNPSWGRDAELDEANARLIAAAPDLLAILREALKEATEAIDSGERFLDPRCRECNGSRPDRYESETCWIHKARKLIGEA